jgi:nitrogen regulatory protein P-II 1
MKQVTAVIKPFRVDEVKEALLKIGLPGLSITEIRGFGRQRGHTEVYRGAEYTIDLIPKIRIDIVVDDVMAGLVADTIVEAARTGTIGDGKVWITSVESVIRIRTGELDEDAV